MVLFSSVSYMIYGKGGGDGVRKKMICGGGEGRDVMRGGLSELRR